MIFPTTSYRPKGVFFNLLLTVFVGAAVVFALLKLGARRVLRGVPK